MREFLYGRQAVLETLRANRRHVFKLIVAENAQTKGTLAEALALAGTKIPVQHVPRPQLDKIHPDHQGIVAETSHYLYLELATMLEMAPAPALLLVLDCIQDPQNLGTLLRTAEAVGVAGVIFPQHHAAAVTPAVVNAASGATEHLRIAQVTNLTAALKRLKEADIWVAGLEVDPTALEYTLANLTGALALVVGSEGQGISRLVKETCDFLIKLPMHGRIGSLNAAVAGSIALYEILRQRRQAVQVALPGNG